jgi:hypothetical protein
MTVVRGAARRRWILVLTVVALLCAVPVAVRVWPVHSAKISPQVLRERIRASVGQPFQGYALSTGAVGLPELPRLAQVTALLTGTTRMRAWYAGRDRWRVDVIDVGSERGLYRTPDGEYLWDYTANHLTDVVGDQPVRLPRAADLLPPDLARRALAAAAGDRVTALPARRVAGIAAAGLRITATEPHTTVRSIDVWADPATGLPLQTEITGRGASRPILVTRFLEVRLATPAPAALIPPAPGARIGFTVTRTLDIVSALDRDLDDALPDQIAGEHRRAGPSGLAAVGVYGRDLAQFVALPLPGRIGAEAYDAAVRWGGRLTVPGGEGALISTSLLSVAIVRSTGARRVYLLAGLVDGPLLQQAAADLTRVEP